ncbi:PREDICTED: uncharacterized protein LOC105567747 [Vollenhovia emeryi]|uniref:uncharacterized protein LOC105567747 n=1 Tax=Vollenhovia emeryi TaxID=411798 RepID=UPI0005F4484A|nr:PREDICTED: uncharacterized protein LOC105567747 [Vollenhovia emeryi]
MLSINMRVFKTVLLIAFFGAGVRCSPIADKPTESTVEFETKTEVTSVVPQEAQAVTLAPTSTYPDATDFYDQRQNGSDNYRIHVDGFVMVFAPVEALLLAAAAGTPTTENLIPGINSHSASSTGSQPAGDPDKPAVDGAHSNDAHNKTEQAISKTIHKQPAVRLANLLAPLIRRMRGTSVH